MKKAALILAAFFLAIPFIGNAQIINIDKSDTSDYQNKAKSSFNFSTGLEVDKQQITLWDATNTAEWMLQKKKELLIAACSYRFTYNGPDDILNAGYIHLRFRHNYKNKYQPETFVQYQWDSKRGLEYRALTGANIRYNLWRGDKWDFNTGIGLMYEEEKWNYAAVDSNKIPTNPVPITNRFIKLNSYIRLDWKASDNSDIAVNIFIQTRPNQFKPRIAPHVQWNINASKHVGFTISYSGIYDDSPVVPIHKFYYSLSNSILIKI
ncbi:MAG: DUF481 domain-containing protein [Bacteroidota bacterium]